MQRCDSIFTALEIYLRMHFPGATIVLLRGQPLFDDLARLTAANSGVQREHICLWPAVASGGANGTTTVGTRPFSGVTPDCEGNTSMDYGDSGFTWLQQVSEHIVLGKDAVRMRISKLANTAK